MIKTFTHWIKEAKSFQPSIEFVEIDISTPQFRSYDVLDNNRKVGTLDLSFLGELGKDELEIAGLIIDPRFQRQNIGSRVIAAIWKEYPHVNRIFLQSIDDAREFWRKMGAKESSRNNYWELNRK